MQAQNKHTFYLPEELSSKPSTMAAGCYNLAHTLLKRSEANHVFIPIRSMQYLAIIEGFDIWFVDSQAYAVHDNQGGRMITISWHSARAETSLQENIDMRVVFYQHNMGDVQLRLVGEFRRAMQLVDQRYRDTHIPGEGALILPLQR